MHVNRSKYNQFLQLKQLWKSYYMQSLTVVFFVYIYVQIIHILKFLKQARSITV